MRPTLFSRFSLETHPFSSVMQICFGCIQNESSL
jgi:hypothetical protein